jgi:uncharacterized repeat protein (TIGR03803 family)
LNGSTAFSQYTKLLDFGSTTASGTNPHGAVISDGTFLYGMTYQGGLHGAGNVFKIKTDGSSYASLTDFINSTTGANPMGTLLYDGTFLYGLTSNGGPSPSEGTIFKITPDGGDFATTYNFVDSIGSYPQASLISDGTYLYGTTYGGMQGGTVFKIKPDGTGAANLRNFTGVPDGSLPFGSLVYDGTFLYGMTATGGLHTMLCPYCNYDGTIFKMKPDGSGYVKLLDFDPATTGMNPKGSLIYDGTYLYGMTGGGGLYNKGVAFKIKPDGTGYTNLLNFDIINGANPQGSFITDGTYLYGMTSNGGINNNGVIFKIKPDGSNYTKLLDFDSVSLGKNPYGDLMLDGNMLYGMTEWGGTNNGGVLFKYDLSPTGIGEITVNNQLSVFPNPATTDFTIQLNSEFKNSQLEIFNNLGEKILEQVINQQSTKINLKSPAGIYFVKVSDGEKIYTQKLVIQ